MVVHAHGSEFFFFLFFFSFCDEFLVVCACFLCFCCCCCILRRGGREEEEDGDGTSLLFSEYTSFRIFSLAMILKMSLLVVFLKYFFSIAREEVRLNSGIAVYATEYVRALLVCDRVAALDRLTSPVSMSTASSV